MRKNNKVRFGGAVMITCQFENRGKDSLYEYLYKQIKSDILTFRLSPDEKLPSKRSLAKHLNVSTITVENAYSQLMAEGYIYSKPKSGFYVSRLQSTSAFADIEVKHEYEEVKSEKKRYQVDFIDNSAVKDSFPFSAWTKLMRETMSENSQALMMRSPSQGIWELRKAISDNLMQFRGMSVNPDRIVIGAGTEYLYGLIIQLLGHDKKYAVEDPGYQKISKIYGSNRVDCIHVPIDSTGINISVLEESNADILHISPSHHFPTGIVTPVSKRYEILAWAGKSENRYIIEDDYDSEFRMMGKPIPSLQSIDNSGKVIYINTFSKSLASTIRISYMILPEELIDRYRRELGFYSCTVSNFEQYTLAAFIKKGYFEKHINRMRTYYRNQRDSIVSAIKKHKYFNRVEIKEENSGLHFLLWVDTDYSDEELIERASQNGVNISCLSQYYYDRTKSVANIIIINYSGIHGDRINQSVELLFRCIWE